MYKECFLGMIGVLSPIWIPCVLFGFCWLVKQIVRPK